jgi:iron(II)-dependent oxidoreductase
MSQDTPPADPVQDIQVRLKSLFGLQPKYYLAGIYAITILALLFWVLVWPGLSHPGTEVTITSTPPGAAVFYGDKHYGTTPLKAFLPEGKAALVVTKPGFVAQTQDFVSGNNLLFSAFFPKTAEVTADLKPVSDDSVARHYTAEIGRWSLAIPFSTTYRFPPLYTGLAADAKAAGWDAARTKEFLLALRPTVADPQMYLDYGRALGLWGADSPVPEGLETQFNLWAPLVGGPSDRLALWLLANQTKPLRDRESTASEMSDWFKAKVSGFQDSLKASVTPTFGAAPGSVRGGSTSYHGVGAATFLWGSVGTTFSLPTEAPYQLPVPVSTSAFWIADSEVTQAQFASFVAANPQWAPAGRDALVNQGQADADYLKEWTDGKPTAPAEPVASVSWYAAQAYVNWLNATGQVPGGKKAVLPTDFQWEAAARSPSGAELLNQGVWEWTASAYAPGDALVWSDASSGKTDAYARSLKGGVGIGKGGIQAGDRAGWPAAGAMPTLGFRVALVGAP